MRQADRTSEMDRTVHRLASIHLARRHLWWYCRLMAPDFYTDDKIYLKDLCDQLEAFWRSDEERFMVVNMPPRHGKSYTAERFTQWVMGHDPSTKIITVSYNEILSTTFARAVRNTIQERKGNEDTLVYSDVFPETKVKEGDAQVKFWSTEKGGQYLATSPTGTATGIGANLILCDDLVKNAQEAYNERELEKKWRFFTDTLMSRRERGQKIVFIMTRWAVADPAGRAMAHFSSIGYPPRRIVYRAMAEDGSMLCPSILSAEDYKIMLRTMDPGIVRANYQQEPVDEVGRLYAKGFRTYRDLPDGITSVESVCDTADRGQDFLCSIVYAVHDTADRRTAYVLDVVYTQEPMEVTEDLVTEQLARTYFGLSVSRAVIESNNGGRGFRRNIERKLRERGEYSTVLEDRATTANKEARILTGAPWLLENLVMPEDWSSRWPSFFDAMVHYKRQGGNVHDDAPDCATMIYDIMTENSGGLGNIWFLD